MIKRVDITKDETYQDYLEYCDDEDLSLNKEKFEDQRQFSLQEISDSEISIKKDELDKPIDEYFELRDDYLLWKACPCCNIKRS